MKVVIISFDQLSLRFLGCYGNQSSPTPHFNRLASESVVFDQHFGENFEPAAANHAWWTGRYQFPLSKQQQLASPLIFTKLDQADIQTRLLFETGANIPNAICEGLIAQYQSADLLPDQLIQQGIQELQSWNDQPETSALLWLHFAGLSSTDSDARRLKWGVGLD